MANLNGSSSSSGRAEASEQQKCGSERMEKEASATVTTATDELQKVNDFFEANSSAIEKWLKERASDEVISRLHAITRSKEKASEHRSSVTSELYQQWLASSVRVGFPKHSHSI